MLLLRAAQLAAMTAVADDKLAGEIADFLSSKHSAATPRRGRPYLERLARQTVRRCRRYGMTARASFYWYATVALDVSPGFDKQRAIALVLNDQSVPPDARIQALWERTTDAHWDEARRLPADPEW